MGEFKRRNKKKGARRTPFNAAQQVLGPCFEIFDTNLLLAECKVSTASYWPSFFLPFMAQARSKEGKNEDP